jgi:hypothetical protein
MSRTGVFAQLEPFEREKAALDTHDAIAKRDKRAEAHLDELPEYEVMKLNMRLTLEDQAFVNAAGDPRNWPVVPSAKEQRAVDAEARRRWRQVAIKQIATELRLADEQALRNRPARLEAEKAWNEFTARVSALAWRQGNRESVFVANFVSLIAQRNDADDFEDQDAVRSIDARLFRLLGFPYPATTPATNGTAANGTATKTRSRRLTRPLASVGTN